MKGFVHIKSAAVLISSCILVLLFTAGSQAQFTDSENCLWCHRYPTLGRYDDKTGEKRVYYINEENFAVSGHGNLTCTSCHVGLDSIPHPDRGKVDCSVRCHAFNQATNQEYTHSDMVKRYEASAHGRGTEEKPKPHLEDLPLCQYCHDNQIADHSDETGRKTWARRSQRQIVDLCTSCHQDREMMANHDLEVIDTLKDTFHWEMLKYGVKDAPDCISCHVPLGYSSHDIRTGSDPISPVNPANRVNTCSFGSATRECHPNATADFAKGRVHAYGIKEQLLQGKSVFDVEGRYKALMAKRNKDNISEEDALHYIILEAVKLLYKLLIGGVVIFMVLHQLLDYLKSRKKHGLSD